MTEALDPDPERRAALWLTAWDATGIHRTATKGDEAGAAWLAEAAAALGAAVSIEEFAIDRLDPVAAYLEFDGSRIPGVPAFDAPATAPDGVSGRLGEDIAVAELPPSAVYSGEYQRRRQAAARQRGFVIICTGERPGLGLLNAEQFRQPYGAPAIHLASEAREMLLAAAAAGAPARLVAASRRTPATARNLVIALDGRDAGGRPLVVMTPRSSWWQSTAERGGGIVAWLESLRALLAAPPARPVLFTANTGHELGHLGLDDFVARRPGCEERATWLHFGANLGAAGGSLSVMSAREDLRDMAAAELARCAVPHRLSPHDRVPSGETRDIHLKGGHYLTFVGSNPLFHLPQDRWPEAVDVGRVAAIAAAGAHIARQLADAG